MRRSFNKNNKLQKLFVSIKSIKLNKPIKFSWIKLRRKVLSHPKLLRILILGAFLLVLVFILNMSKKAVLRTNISYYYKLTSAFVFKKGTSLKNKNGVTNILIMGKGGAGHEAPDLTDTMMVLSLNSDKNIVNLVTIPRDVWIPEQQIKINSAYYWGEKKGKETGYLLSESSVEEILGQPIHYYALLDFEGFSEIIDAIGGIDMDIKNEFVDKKYPIFGKENDNCSGDPQYGCRYETIEFKKGIQHMDGQTALKFVRSRMAEGDEGTDFARSERQKEVVLAVKDKISSLKILTSPSKIKKITKVVRKNLQTDMKDEEMALILRKTLDSKDNIQNLSITDYLENPKPSNEFNNLYVLIPKDRNWDKTHEFISCKFYDCTLRAN